MKNRHWYFQPPHIPYKWEHTEAMQGGFFCVFDQHFFHQYGSLHNYTVFQPNGNHVFELTDEQFTTISKQYERMFEELNSDYIYKYDVIRTMVYEIVHFALKTQPTKALERNHVNASQRITNLFIELLERQFPIDDAHQTMLFRSPSDYANNLNVHVNHLNRAVKEVMNQTTSQVIADRMAREARLLLKQTQWTVSEIAYALGFSQPTHFHAFFKKHEDKSPKQYRNV